MGLFEWGEKRFARGIAKAMIRSYKAFKKSEPNLSEIELIKLTLSTRPGEPAKQLFNDMDDPSFWRDVAGGSFAGITNLLIRLEYIERMRGTLNSETQATNLVFKNIVIEEMQKAAL
jgi:hypothetical protein